jgi:hypothetical protein
VDAKIVEPFSESILQGYESGLKLIPRFVKFSR